MSFIKRDLTNMFAGAAGVLYIMASPALAIDADTSTATPPDQTTSSAQQKAQVSSEQIRDIIKWDDQSGEFIFNRDALKTTQTPPSAKTPESEPTSSID